MLLDTYASGSFNGVSLMKLESCLSSKVMGGRNVHKLNGLSGEEKKEVEEEQLDVLIVHGQWKHLFCL